MKRAHAFTAVILSAGLTVAACGPDTDRREPDGIGRGTATTDERDRRTDMTTTGQPATTTAQQGMPMTITGCVAEQNNQLVLTQLEPGVGAQRPAGVDSYQLVGETAELRQHIGQRVRVMGESMQQTAQMAPAGEPGAQAGARDTTTTPGADRSPIGTTGEPGRTGMDAANTLRVSSVTPVDGECPSPGNR
jgi:hypothetical protein